MMEKEPENSSLDKKMTFLGFFQKGDSENQIQCFFFNKTNENVIKELRNNIEKNPFYKYSNQIILLLQNYYKFENIIIGETLGDNNDLKNTTLVLYGVSSVPNKPNENRRELLNLLLFKIVSMAKTYGENYIEVLFYTRSGADQALSVEPKATTKIKNIIYIPIEDLSIGNEIKTGDEKIYDMSNWKKNQKKAGNKDEKFESSIELFCNRDNLIFSLDGLFQKDCDTTIYMMNANHLSYRHKKIQYLHIMENDRVLSKSSVLCRQDIINLL